MRLSKHRMTRLSQKMMMDLVARFRGHEPIGREYIRKLREEVGDALRSGDWRVVRRRLKEDKAAEARLTTGEAGEAGQKTLWLETSKERK